MRKKNRAVEIILLDFRLYLKVRVIRAVWSWHRNKHIDQWNRIESLEINPYTYDQLIYDKVGKITQWRKDNIFLSETVVLIWILDIQTFNMLGPWDSVVEPQLLLSWNSILLIKFLITMKLMVFNKQ